jgi:hypothetical protein
MSARPIISVANALRHKHLFGPHFHGPSWDTWRAVLKAAFGETLSALERAAFKVVAEREPPTRRVKSFAAIVGRGGGKDSTASFIASFIAMCFDPRAAKLRIGELAYVLCLAVDRDQAAIQFRYIKAFFEEVPTLKALVRKDGIGRDSIELKNRVVIQVSTNSFRTVRGRSLLCTVFDECAFYRSDESANPDTEVHGAVLPGLARVPGSMLIMISSAHKRSGLIYDQWKDHYGRDDDDVLVVKGTTRQFNPLFDQGVIDKALAKDPQQAAAEYNSVWRDDLAEFLSRELIESAVERGVIVRPPIMDVAYSAFCDSSSGRGDAFTACIAHKEPDRIVIDCLFERKPPFNPGEVIEDIARLIKTYRCTEITGDKYAVGFVVEAFGKSGIQYLNSPLDRSEIYLGFLPLVTSGQLLLIDHPRAIAQFAALERRTFPSGKDRIDHPTHGHDDIANSIAGAAVLAARPRYDISFPAPIVFGVPRDIPGNTYHGGSFDTPTHDTRSTTQKYIDWVNGGGISDYWSPP